MSILHFGRIAPRFEVFDVRDCKLMMHHVIVENSIIVLLIKKFVIASGNVEEAYSVNCRETYVSK